MFAPHRESARIDLQIVALDDTPRLRRCVASLAQHESADDFTITCVINRTTRRSEPAPDLGDGVRVLTPEFNLGWAGGLHLARAHTSAEYLVWVQDDMTVTPGWLDALVATADAYPDAGAVGSVAVDAHGRPNGHAGGFAVPPDRVDLWNPTDAVRAGEAVADTRYDWVTSKGMLTRSAAWDDVGGTDPRLFPLNHVDKDYSSHLRCHGWSLRVALDAQLLHEQSRSAPSVFRQFLPGWQEPDFNARWGGPLTELLRGEARHVPHECAEWDPSDLSAIERLVGREASRMLVAVARHSAQHELSEVEAERARTTAQFFATSSWRVTAPLRALVSAVRRRR